MCIRDSVIATDQIIIILAGALAGGLVNGLTGFGTALTAVGLWLFAIPPSVAAPLAILCSVVTQIQTLKGQRFLLAARVAEDDGAKLTGVSIVFADDLLLGGHRLRKLLVGRTYHRIRLRSAPSHRLVTPARDAIVDFVRRHR